MNIENLHKKMRQEQIRSATQLAGVAGANEDLNYYGYGVGFSDRASTIRALDIIASGILDEMESMGCLGLAFDILNRVQMPVFDCGIENINN